MIFVFDVSTVFFESLFGIFHSFHGIPFFLV